MDGPWKVYFELNGKTDDDVVKFLQENVDTRSIWYIHPSGKVKGPHCHGLIYDHRQTAETFRNKIKKYYDLTTQGSFAISNKYERGTVMKDEHTRKYIVYMTKGKFEPILSIGYGANDITEMRSEWREPTAVHISGDLTVITHGSVKKSRITQVTIARMAIEEYNGMITPENAKQMYDDPDHNLMYKIVTKKLKENGMSTNYRQESNIIQDMLSTLDPRRHRNKVLSMI